jgi:hypothetical protein
VCSLSESPASNEHQLVQQHHLRRARDSHVNYYHVNDELYLQLRLGFGEMAAWNWIVYISYAVHNLPEVEHLRQEPCSNVQDKQAPYMHKLNPAFSPLPVFAMLRLLLVRKSPIAATLNKPLASVSSSCTHRYNMLSIDLTGICVHA